MSYTHKKESTCGFVHMQDEREIPSIVNEKIVINCFKFSHFGWGYLASNGSREQMN